MWDKYADLLRRRFVQFQYIGKSKPSERLKRDGTHVPMYVCADVLVWRTLCRHVVHTLEVVLCSVATLTHPLSLRLSVPPIATTN